MSKRVFNEKQIKGLLKNVNVARCSDRSISYTKEFKLLAVKQYQEGKIGREIFQEAGFNIKLIGKDLPKGCLLRWRRKYQLKEGIGLSKDERGKSGNCGRPKTKGLTDTDRIKRMTIEIAYLKAENDFLAKLRAAKKR